MKILVTIPAFNRPAALRRLLRSLSTANYDGLDVYLRVVLDGGASPEVREVAFENANSIDRLSVHEHPTNLGLRRNILYCGDLVMGDFDAVVVLEDDIGVHRQFAQFAAMAINATNEEDRIAGISLYAPEINEYESLPFEPLKSDHDVYLMQIPCSWGQVWTKSQWKSFSTWYQSESCEPVVVEDGVHPAVASWSKKSWKKYFAKYLVRTERFVVYPYSGFSTNHSDSGGQHIVGGTGKFEVCKFRLGDATAGLKFPENFVDWVKYDSFYELSVESLMRAAPEDFFIPGELCVDFFGSKPFGVISAHPWVLTTRLLNGSVELKNSWMLHSRPWHENLVAERHLSSVKYSILPMLHLYRILSVAPECNIFGGRQFFGNSACFYCYRVESIGLARLASMFFRSLCIRIQFWFEGRFQ